MQKSKIKGKDTKQASHFEPEDSVEKVLSFIHEKKNNFWIKERENKTLELFHAVARGVSAYKDFLKKNHINHEKIETFKDFEQVPHIDKSNYIRQYSLGETSWDPSFLRHLVSTSTSGSTGEPTYFSRDKRVDWQASVIHELFYQNASGGKDVPTLVIVCFGMGVWIGGIITYQAFEMLGQRGYPISIITPGINKEEIFKAIKNISPHFKQTILAGYPPFIKDIIDEAPGKDINLKELNIKLLFAAEAFTEKFRNHLVKKVGIRNPYLETMNIYGSADIGAMAFETPLSILIRQIALKKPKLFKSIFSPIEKTPTLAQYIPSFINFEAPNGEIILTGNNSIPLLRYSIGDHGGVYSFNQMLEKLTVNGISLYREAKAVGIEKHLYQLPFVFVYERMDFSTTLYGLQVYPETIREVLLEKPFDEIFTGKLTLITKYNDNQDQYLEINLELLKDKSASPMIEQMLLDRVMTNLRTKNSEFRELSNYLKERAIPRTVFWPHEDPLYFKKGIKQEWVKKIQNGGGNGINKI